MRPAFGVVLAFLGVLSISSCGDPSPCGGGFFESCELDDPQAMQAALARPEARLAYPGSHLVDQAAKGLKGENTPSGTEGRVTRIFQLQADASFADAIRYYDDRLTALGWGRAAEPADWVMSASVTPDNFVRWTKPAGGGGDVLVLASAELPAGRYRAQFTVDGLDSAGRDDDSYYLQTKLDSPDPRFPGPSTKASASR